MKVYLLTTKPCPDIYEFGRATIHGVFSTRDGAINAAKQNRLYSCMTDTEVFEVTIDEIINNIKNFKIL